MITNDIFNRGIDRLTRKLDCVEAAVREGGTTASPSYKVYTALLTQSGTNAPTATILENTLGDITFTRENNGNYNIISNNLFTTDKTFYQITLNFGSQVGILSSFVLRYINSGFLYLVTRDDSGEFDDFLINTPIEIRVYN